jgi:hypothetical protein
MQDKFKLGLEWKHEIEGIGKRMELDSYPFKLQMDWRKE